MCFSVHNENNIFFDILLYFSVVHYDLRNLEIPTIDVVGSLVNSGIRVLVYRYMNHLYIFPDQPARETVNGNNKNLNTVEIRIRLSHLRGVGLW